MSSWSSVIAAVIIALVGRAVVGIVGDEVRGRLDLVPRVLLRLARRRLPVEVREELQEEWQAELEVILRGTEALPITRLAVGLRFAASLLAAAPAIGRALTGGARRSFLRAAATPAGFLGGSVIFVVGTWQVDGGFGARLALLPMFTFPLFAARWALTRTRRQAALREATVASFGEVMAMKDPYTARHGRRVSRGARSLAQELGMGADRVSAVEFAGRLHDVGKLSVPSKVLQKSGALTEQEYAAIQLHPMRGLEIIKEIGLLDEVVAGVMHHHEKMNGRGYPMGLSGDEIPEFARIIAVVDAFDSMMSGRGYRMPRSTDEAIAELRRCAGEFFDTAMVLAFIQMVERDGWEAWQAAPNGEDGRQ